MIVTTLTPNRAGHWLAAVKLLTYGPGWWAPPPTSHPTADLVYHHDGPLPPGPVLADQLAELGGWATAEPSRWLNHCGQATPAKTAVALADAVELVDPDPEAFAPDAHLTTAGKGWMVDDGWRTPPSAYTAGPLTVVDLPTVPAYTAALAFLACHGPLVPAWSTWVAPTRPVGWVWSTPPDPGPDPLACDGFPSRWCRPDPVDPPLESTVVVWGRASRVGEPHPGALGWGTVARAEAPGWARTVRAGLGGPPGLGEIAARIMDREPPVDPDPVGLDQIAARFGAARGEITRAVLPPPRWRVGKAWGWSWSADVVPWAEATGRPVPVLEGGEL